MKKEFNALLNLQNHLSLSNYHLLPQIHHYPHPPLLIYNVLTNFFGISVCCLFTNIAPTTNKQQPVEVSNALYINTSNYYNYI